MASHYIISMQLVLGYPTPEFTQELRSVICAGRLPNICPLTSVDGQMDEKNGKGWSGRWANISMDRKKCSGWPDRQTTQKHNASSA